jgi:hypothetical protein
METHTNRDRTTWRDWVIGLAFMAFVGLVVPVIAYALPLDVALFLAFYIASVIIRITLALGRRAS